jgi:hypothetical protein
LGEKDVSSSTTTEGMIAKRFREEVEERILKSQIERKIGNFFNVLKAAFT